MEIIIASINTCFEFRYARITSMAPSTDPIFISDCFFGRNYLTFWKILLFIHYTILLVWIQMSMFNILDNIFNLFLNRVVTVMAPSTSFYFWITYLKSFFWIVINFSLKNISSCNTRKLTNTISCKAGIHLISNSSIQVHPV